MNESKRMIQSSADIILQVAIGFPQNHPSIPMALRIQPTLASDGNKLAAICTHSSWQHRNMLQHVATRAHGIQRNGLQEPNLVELMWNSM